MGTAPSVANLLSYRHFRTTTFPFVTAPAPTDASPKYVAGSNLMTSYKGYTERRPGFDVALEPTPTTFTDTIQRVFCWRRWGGTFYIMLCTVGTVATVYKLALGTDASFGLLFTSAGSEPFDFVVSNNFCFFGNGTEMRKFDGTTVTKWGISAPNQGNTGATFPGAAADLGATWTNINNIKVDDGAFATVSVLHGATSSTAQGTNFGFAIPATATINGILVEIKGFVTGGGSGFGGNTVAQLVKAGAAVGSTVFNSLSGSSAYIAFGSSTFLWGSTWAPADINASNFGVNFIVKNPSLVGTAAFSVDAVRITVFYTDTSTGAPTTSVSGTGITASTGWTYVYCYMNSVTGHVSSPSPPSASTGPVTNKTVNVSVIASTDPQVDKIRIFRTTDGGGGVWFEIAGGPFANATTSYPDTTTDANLSVITAPTFGFNDPPPNGKGMVWFANRIWFFQNATLYFTDWEEMNIGVPEEGSVSGPAGNFWNFSSEITGLSVAQDGVLVFLAGGIYKISGDSLSTFWRTVIAGGLGCRNRATITRLGGLTAFLANTNSVWTTDSTSLTEISAQIQPTIDNIDHSQASIAVHFQGQYRWLLLCDGGHQQTIPFDLNVEQWMPPWSIVPTAITSGETSPGVFTLLIGQQTSKKMLQMIPGQYTDNGSTYGMSGTLNTIPLVNEHLSSGSPIIDLFYPQAPEHVAELEYVAMETNSILPTTVKRSFDDDPTLAAFTDITNVGTNPVVSPLHTATAVNVLDRWYYDRAASGKRCSVQFNYAAANNNPKLYTLTLAYKQVR